MGRLLALLLIAGSVLVVTPARAADVIVNGVRLDDATVAQLEAAYRTPIRPGRYWYDPISGVWGFEGGPSAGQIMPMLRLGGPLRPDASKGDTGVFINGRELHRLDVMALQRCVPTYPGRYWVRSDGVGGLEGYPPSFDLNALCAAAARAAGGAMQCESYGGGQYNCGRADTRTGVTGVIGEGGGRAGVYTDRGLIMTPN